MTLIIQIQIKLHLYSVLDKWLIMYKVQATELVLNFKVGRQSIFYGSEMLINRGAQERDI